MFDSFMQVPPCPCGDAACFGECPDCGAHAPYVHELDCRQEENQRAMVAAEEALSLCKEYGVTVDRTYMARLVQEAS